MVSSRLLTIIVYVSNRFLLFETASYMKTTLVFIAEDYNASQLIVELRINGLHPTIVRTIVVLR